MGVRTFMAGGMTAGDQDQDTREVGVATEGEGTGVEETEETGVLKTGSAEESFEGGERTGESLPGAMLPNVCAVVSNKRDVTCTYWLFQIQRGGAWSAWCSRLL